MFIYFRIYLQFNIAYLFSHSFTIVDSCSYSSTNVYLFPNSYTNVYLFPESLSGLVGKTATLSLTFQAEIGTVVLRHTFCLIIKYLVLETRICYLYVLI